MSPFKLTHEKQIEELNVRVESLKEALKYKDSIIQKKRNEVKILKLSTNMDLLRNNTNLKLALEQECEDKDQWVKERKDLIAQISHWKEHGQGNYDKLLEAIDTTTGIVQEMTLLKTKHDILVNKACNLSDNYENLRYQKQELHNEYAELAQKLRNKEKLLKDMTESKEALFEQNKWLVGKLSILENEESELKIEDSEEKEE